MKELLQRFWNWLLILLRLRKATAAPPPLPQPVFIREPQRYQETPLPPIPRPTVPVKPGQVRVDVAAAKKEVAERMKRLRR